MKAWFVEPRHQPYSSESAYVCAETRGQAINNALCGNAFNGWDYLDLKATRAPALDGGWTLQKFIEGGYCGWWPCQNCERHIGNEDDWTICDDIDDESTCREIEPVYDGDVVYCSDACRRQRLDRDPLPPVKQTFAELSSEW